MAAYVCMCVCPAGHTHIHTFPFASSEACNFQIVPDTAHRASHAHVRPKMTAKAVGSRRSSSRRLQRVLRNSKQPNGFYPVRNHLLDDDLSAATNAALKSSRRKL